MTASGIVLLDDDPAAGDGGNDNTEKLAKGAIVMMTPADYMPSRLAGRVLRVFSEAEAADLESAGWVRKSTSSTKGHS